MSKHRSRRPRSLLLALMVVAGVFVAALVPLAAPQPAYAAVGSNFDAGFILSDETFYNRGAMNNGQIQAFLADKGSGCRDNALPCLKNLRTDVAPRAGDQYCGALPAMTAATAGQVFEAVAIACGVNPQVLLVLVEKEQSLLTRSNPSDYSYRYATGFACPDTPPGCSSATAGFVTQVYLAAKQFQRYRINPGNYNYQAGRANNILFNPSGSCGSSSVFIRNQATAGLYNYTPYQPNSAALNNLYGSGDGCSSYGNRNFWRMFTDWFGGTSNLLDSASFEGNVNGWAFVSGVIARSLAGPTTDAQSGQHYLSMYTGVSGRSIAQDIRISVQPRQTFSGSVWVKSGTVGKTYTGVLAVWALGGGSTEVSSTPFTVGETWTEITAALPIERSGHNMVRFEVYMRSTDALFSMDASSLTQEVAQATTTPLSLTSPSFESGYSGWGPVGGAMTLSTVPMSDAKDGSAVLIGSVSQAGTSIAQDVRATAYPGDRVTVTIWVRSTKPDVPFEGTLALWGLGSAAEAAATAFVAGADWTPVSTTLQVSKPGLAVFRAELYFRTANLDVQLDAASLAPNLISNPSFESGADGWNSGTLVNVLDRVAGAPPVAAIDGANVARSNAAYSGGSFATDVARRTAVGEIYTGTIWLRAASSGDTWDGTLAMWGLGGVAEAATTQVSVSDEWTPFTVQLPVTQAGHTTLRLELYSGSPGEQLYVDGAVLR
jgi:hypothetical protein